jgi:hypothetical protein
MSQQLQVVRADAPQRRDRPHQHVVPAAIAARLLDRGHVLRLFDDAEQPRVAVVGRAVAAGIHVRDVAADRTVRDALLDGEQCRAQRLDFLARRLQQVKREARRAPCADAADWRAV